MVTYPGLPAPEVTTHLSRAQAETAYGPGVTFHIGMVHLCTNTEHLRAGTACGDGRTDDARSLDPPDRPVSRRYLRAQGGS